MKYLVNFATPYYYEGQLRLNESALKHGIDKVISLRQKDIADTEFFEKNKKILTQKRGAGYWLWKPYIILDALSKSMTNDIVVYADCSIEILEPLDILFEICTKQEGIMLFRMHGLDNKSWTKRDCFVLMGCDAPEYWHTDQLTASFSIFINNDRNRAFLEEWLYYGCNENIMTDIENICGLENFPEFVEHRWDQSIFSLLSIKHKIEIYRNPTQYGDGAKEEGNYPNSPYERLLYAHPH